MKKIIFFLFSLTVSLANAQTGELPVSKYLLEQYNLVVNVEKSYSQLTAPIKYGVEKYCSVISQCGKISTITNNYTPRGEYNSILVLWDSKNGKISSFSELGDDSNRVNITETKLTPDGKIFVYGYAYLTKTQNLILGNQSFNFRRDTLPGYVSATFDLQTNTWSNVSFYYVGDRSINYIDEASHYFDSNGNIYFCGTYTAPYIIINQDTIIKGSTNVHPFFVAKLRPDYTKLWAKQCQFITSNTSLYNITFGLDKNYNIFIAGGIGYITGQISLDGYIVKNDTISNSSDYTYTDLFLYKMDSSGTVKFGKTYLFRGTEQLSQMIVRNDGAVYLCGDYDNEFAAPGGTFPPSLGGDLFYNTFVTKVNPANGSFDWGQSIAGNLYYQDRFRQIVKDDSDNLYVASRFVPLSISFMGHTFQKRTSDVNASQILFARLLKDGSFSWGSVLGANTSYTSVIEHQTFSFWGMEGNNMFLSVPKQTYGSNNIFAWGDSLVATTTVSSGAFGNTLVITADSGIVKYNYGKVLSSMTAIDSTDYLGLNADFTDYNFCRLSNKTTTLSGTVFVNNNPLKSSLYTSIQLLSLSSAEIGAIKGYGSVDTLGNYIISDIPHGKYLVQAIPSDSTLMASYYKLNVPSDWKNADTVDLNYSQSNINIHVQKVPWLTGGATVRGSIIIVSQLNPSVQYYSNVQVKLLTDNIPYSVMEFIRPFQFLSNTYSYEFTNIPVGNYKVVVDFPFATTIDTANIIINAPAQIIDSVDFKIINENIYLINTVISSVNETIKNNISILFDNNTNNLFICDNSNINERLSIYNLNGMKIYTCDFTNKISIDLNSFTSGIYLINVGNKTKKIAIIK
jgi:hypothetical protein